MGDALPLEEHSDAFARNGFFAQNGLIPDENVYTLATDLFSWLETEWQLPLPCAQLAKPPLPRPIELTKEMYTVTELNRLYGLAGVGAVLRRYAIKASGSILGKGRSAAVYSVKDLAPLISYLGVDLTSSPVLIEEAYTIEELVDLFPGADHRYCYKLVRRHGLVQQGSRASQGKPIPLYKKEDLKPALVQWEGDRLIKTLNEWWRRFFPPACQKCDRCQQHGRNPLLQQVMCQKPILNQLRFAVASFLREVLRLGSVNRWWSVHRRDPWEREPNAAWRVVFLYLLDRRLLTLAIGDLLRIKSLCSMSNEDRTRLWRKRYPQEYQQFCTALQATNYRDSAHEFVLKVLSLLVLLRYGLVNLAELGHPLSQDELRQVCQEHRLVTLHLSHGMFLPFPLSNDIRIGHVILDEIRMYFWEYAARRERGKYEGDTGPRHWKLEFVRALEQALAAPMYEEKKSILSRRPEIEHPLSNPLRLQQKGVREENSYMLLPPAVREHMTAYVSWCYQEQELVVSTLQSRVTALLHFFTWGRLQGVLVDYPQWSREKTQQVFRSYEATKCLEMKANSRSGQLSFLASFFTNLRKLECVVPDGYHILSLLAKGRTWEPRVIPQEEVFDRIFQDGVRQLSYDPFARLALTIQYYCGTRVTETCELHLFCLLEDQQGHAYLLIPFGKTKQERPFPVAVIGMEHLLEYMDQVVSLRLAADGTSRTLGQTNMRYAKEDTERANNWYYLFDRVPIAEGRHKKTRGRLSAIRVGEALREALRFAAKCDADGLFQPGTYSPLCQYRRSKGKECRYFATEDGVTLCPRCGSHLSGHRGSYCHHILEEDFVCDGVAQTEEEIFCPKCDAPLAVFVDLSTHLFRHNSVSRTHNAGISLAHNMRLHGHQTIPMHLRYVHLQVGETTQSVRHLFAEQRLQEVSRVLSSPSGKVVVAGVASTVSLEQYLEVTLRRALKRRTSGLWGGFWAGALAQQGVGSPLSLQKEIVILEESYEHAVAQYWYEALGLAVSEVALETITEGEWRALVPAFLYREKIETLVRFHLQVVQDSLGSPLGRKLAETDIREQRVFLNELADLLRPWWQHFGAIDRLVEMFAPGGGYAFSKPVSETKTGAIDSCS